MNPILNNLAYGIYKPKKSDNINNKEKKVLSSTKSTLNNLKLKNNKKLKLVNNSNNNNNPNPNPNNNYVNQLFDIINDKNMSLKDKEDQINLLNNINHDIVNEVNYLHDKEIVKNSANIYLKDLYKNTRNKLKNN
uniref:Uncharacterized protein n=1 Tax=viral metagenome TaxID=1070528 RepID=A0A6C0EEM9_9ZZZZ